MQDTLIEKQKQILATIFGFAFASIGVLLLFVGCISGLISHEFKKNAVRAAGVVVATPDGGSHPMVRFTTAEGKAITYRQNGMIDGYSVGDQVTVLYSAKDPYDHQLDAFGAVYGNTCVLGCLGSLFFLVGTTEVFRNRQIKALNRIIDSFLAFVTSGRLIEGPDLLANRNR
ncbi:MAG: DUF3592 domain-containing protein [Blastocatellia bacterium]|nr:DUF3592 domain-containing protein [Blastocatellia bacterium]